MPWKAKLISVEDQPQNGESFSVEVLYYDDATGRQHQMSLKLHASNIKTKKDFKDLTDAHVSALKELDTVRDLLVPDIGKDI